jgi:hypothetical protein
MPSEINPQSPGPDSPEPPPLDPEAVARATQLEAKLAAQLETLCAPAEPPPQTPVTLREILAIACLVVLADLTIYRGSGFAGYAAFFLMGPVLLWFGAPRPRLKWGFFVIGLMLVAAAVKTLWCGSVLLVAAGFSLVVAFAMTLSGLCPYVLETAVFASQTILAGYEGLMHYRRSGKLGPVVAWGSWLNIALPGAAFVAFGLLFIVANPDLFVYFGDSVEWFLTCIRSQIFDFAPHWSEILFWCAVSWISVGLLRPVLTRSMLNDNSVAKAAQSEATQSEATQSEATPALVKAALYTPFRNTLLTVIVLFAVYLVFEFQTLWFREIPQGFHYSGYAHEGAAWLTVALGLATVILSLIFRREMLVDPRLSRLRRLAWVWSLENLILAAAVYNRLYIYIGFNGMTRMRTVGLFGMTCVVVGFLLVVWKIAYSRNSTWLLRRHLWALAITVYLYALTPVDTLVCNYNVGRILSGDSVPSVQISTHPISSEGVLVLLPLLDCPDPIVREGVTALLADRLDQAEKLAHEQEQKGWTALQIADRKALKGLQANQAHWAKYANWEKRRVALDKFHTYAYQWY